MYQFFSVLPFIYVSLTWLNDDQSQYRRSFTWLNDDQSQQITWFEDNVWAWLVWSWSSLFTTAPTHSRKSCQTSTLILPAAEPESAQHHILVTKWCYTVLMSSWLVTLTVSCGDWTAWIITTQQHYIKWTPEMTITGRKLQHFKNELHM